MSLTVEPGTGLADAESYCSLADADAYHSRFGTPEAWSGASDSEKETALRVATRYIDATFTFQGERSTTTQALSWPRCGVEADGRCYGPTEIPQALEDATAVLAASALSEDLLPDLSEPGTVASESVDVGPISVSTTYLAGKSPSKRYSLAASLLAPLCGSGGRMVRF